MTERVDPTRGDCSTSPSLTTRVVRGSVWAFVGRLASRGLQVVRMIVLARVLTPKDFGLFGVVTLALAAAETFTQTGFQTALIQKKGDTQNYLDTAWTVQVVRGCVIAGALFASAPLLARFFGEPSVVPLLRAVSAMEVLRGFTNIGIVYFKKELEFHKQVTYEFISSAVGLGVVIVLAWQLRNVWALIWGSLADQVFRTVLSYLFHPYRARLRIDCHRVTALFGFGKWVLGNSIVSFLALQADRAILGRLLGATALGVYNMADRVGGLVPTEFMRLCNDVMMPAYAKVQDNQERLARGFLEVFGAAVSVGGPVAAFIVLAGPNLVVVILGAEWLDAIVPLRVIAVGAFLRAVIGVSSPVFLATGRPNMQFWKSLIRAVVTLGTVYPLTVRYGVTGTALAGVLGVVALSPLFFIAVKIVEVPLPRLVKSALPGIVLTAAAGLGVLPGGLVSGRPVCAFWVESVCSGLFTLAGFLMLGHHDLGPSVIVRRYLKILRTGSEVLSA